MYIEPNSTIKILRGIPWDNTYQHTPRFASRVAQTTYMNSKVAFTLGKHTYIREGRGYLKVEKNVEELIGCNYLMFQNPKPDGTMGKAFYAFITATEYVNPITTEIRYEIDVMQTWFLDCKLGQCFIERSHSSATTNENYVKEDIGLGDYVIDSSTSVDPKITPCVVSSKHYVLKIIDTDTGSKSYSWQQLEGGYVNYGDGTRLVNRMPEILQYNFLDSDTWRERDATEKLLEEAVTTNIAEGILCIGIMPRPRVEGTDDTINVVLDKYEYFEGNGGKIKNDKMFTYPYCKLEITNNQGNKAELKHELIPGIIAKFKVVTDVTPDPIVNLIPMNYRGLELDYENSVQLTDFPMCAWAGDVYKQWLALNKSQREAQYSALEDDSQIALLKGVGNIAGAIGRADPAGGYNAVMSATGNLLHVQHQVDALMAKEQDMKARPAKPIGGKGSANLFCADGMRLEIRQMSLRWDTAKRIDDYFSTFGYAMRCLGTPNIDSREYWNYIKLVNPNITPTNGGVPADDVGAICRILSNGITFWHHPDKLGDYSQDNIIVVR